MSDENTNNLMDQLSQLMQNDNIPSELKNIFNNLNNSTDNSNSKEKNSTTDSSPNIDMETLLKMQQIISSMNSNKDDPRANLLNSLKPYLKETRQKKVDQYVKLFSLGKVLETFNLLGGDNTHEAK